MMNEKWEEQFREQIHGFVGTIEKFDKGEIDRKAYKGISGGFGSYAQRVKAYAASQNGRRKPDGKTSGVSYRGSERLRCGAYEAHYM